MTKLRPPISFERAIDRMSAVISYEAMAKEIGLAARTVRDYSDPDVATGLTLTHALQLETLYRRSGGEGYPISDCFRLRVRIAEGLRDSDDSALFDGAANYLRENGEASAAVMNALRPGATLVDRAIARRELEQAIGAGTDMLRLVTDGEAPISPEPPP